MDRARAQVAIVGLGAMWASDTTEFGLRSHAVLLIGAGTARSGARNAVEVPIADLAINRTRLRVAVLGVCVGRAELSTELWIDNVAYTTLRASAARLGACSPCLPGGDLAVDGAVVPIAGLRLLGHGALFAAEFGLGNDAGASLFTLATGLGAGVPTRPTPNLTVDGAVVQVAVLALLDFRANIATMSGVCDDTTSAGLVTRGGPGGASAVAVGHLAVRARVSAGGPGTPGANFAVNGARAQVAVPIFPNGTARDTTE